MMQVPWFRCSCGGFESNSEKSLNKHIEAAGGAPEHEAETTMDEVDTND